MFQNYLRRQHNVRDRSNYKTPLRKGQPDSKRVDLVENSMSLKPQPASPRSDAAAVVCDVTRLKQSPQVDADVSSRHKKVSSCDTELGVKSSSSQVNGVNDSSHEVSNSSAALEASHASDVNTKTTIYTASDAPSALVMPYDTVPGTESSSGSGDTVQAATVKSDEMKAVNKPSRYPVSEASVVAYDVAASLKASDDHMGEIPATVIKSDDREDGTKMSGCPLNELSVSTVTNGVPAAAEMSRDVEADSKSCSDSVSDMSSSSFASRDLEAGSKANTSEVGIVPVAAVTSHDAEAGTKSTSTGHPSPGRYLRKMTTLNFNYTGSPFVNRTAFPRTNAAYFARTGSADSIGLSEVSLSSSTDTGLSVASTSQDQDSSCKQSNSLSAELPSPSRHVRCRSDSHIVTVQASDEVSMDIRAANSQTAERWQDRNMTSLHWRDRNTASPSSKLFNYSVGSVSAPSTPQRVRLHISFFAC